MSKASNAINHARECSMHGMLLGKLASMFHRLVFVEYVTDA